MPLIIPTYAILEGSMEQAAGVADLAPLWHLLPDQTNPVVAGMHKVGLLALNVKLLDATTTKMALVIPTTSGTPLTVHAPFTVTKNVALNPSSSNVETFTAPPTIGATNYPRRATLLSQGDEFTWSWPEDDPYVFCTPVVGGSSNHGIALKNITGGVSGLLQINVRWIEF